MKTRTQYNDLSGNISADFYVEEVNILQKLGIDDEKYDFLGIDFYKGNMGGNYIKAICLDKEENKPRLINLDIEKKMLIL